jgi:anti-anti-sigma factor
LGLDFLSGETGRCRVQDFQLLLSEPTERILELTLIGEVDHATEGPLREATRTAIASGDYDTLVFDLRRLSFMDSTGLHVLTTAHREMVEAGGATKIVCDSSNLLKIFELTGLDRFFSVVSTRDEAIAVAA